MFQSCSYPNYLHHSPVEAIRSAVAVAAAGSSEIDHLSPVPEEATVVELVPVVADLLFRQDRCHTVLVVAVAVQGPAVECPGSAVAEPVVVEAIWSLDAVELAIFVHLSCLHYCRR